MKRGLFVLLSLLALVACGGVTGIAVDGLRPGAVILAVEDRIAGPADRFPFVDASGDVGLGDFAGQVTILNFWASWCGPCRGEQPELNEAYRELAGDDVAFLGINVIDPEANAAAFRREFDVPYPSLLDRAGEFSASFEGVSPQALPTTIVLDRDGRVALRLFGTTTVGELSAAVGYLVAEA